MYVASAYLHALDGRLRIKVAEVKGSPAKALEIESQLQRCDGINRVTANPTTGNVLVLYDPRRIKQSEIIGTLRALGCLKDTVAAQDGLSHELVKTVVRSTAEFALERLIYSVL